MPRLPIFFRRKISEGKSNNGFRVNILSVLGVHCVFFFFLTPSYLPQIQVDFGEEY